MHPMKFTWFPTAQLPQEAKTKAAAALNYLFFADEENAPSAYRPDARISFPAWRFSPPLRDFSKPSSFIYDAARFNSYLTQTFSP